MKVYVSIIIPVYNSEKYLEQCLESVLQQTFTDYEVIIIDDGSTDGSRLIYEKFTNNDRRFISFHQGNQGVSAARNRGLDAAQGEIIVFLDSDDVIFCDFLDVMVGFFENGHNLVCFAATKFENSICQTNTSEILFQEFIAKQLIEDLLYHRKQLSITRSVFRKSKYPCLRFKDELFICEDVIMLLEILVLYESVIPFVNTELYGYRIHKDSLTHYGNWIRKLTGIKAMDIMENILNYNNIHMNKALINRRMNTMRLIYKTIPWKEKRERDIVWNNIKKYRKTVILDKQSQRKERLASLISLCGQMTYRLFLFLIEVVR